MQHQLENIYNTYQRITGTLSGKPFKYRRNFDDFEKKEPEKYTSLVKVAKILNALPGVNVEGYFEAPYKMFPSEFNGIIIGLDFYHKPRAIRAYTNYIMSEMSVDSNLMAEESRNKVLSGLKRMIEKCRELGCNYETYLSSQDSIPPFVVDLNHGLINRWVLAGLRMCGHNFDGCVDFDLFPEAEFMLGSRDINESLDNMLDGLSEREIRWLRSVIQKVKSTYFS